MSHTAYIYDAVRTPRSKGKAGGSLNSVKPIDLGATLLRELQRRHDLDTSYVDDVVMGCVTPIGEQGGDVAKMIVQNADWDESVAGVQLDRFCASGLEAVNIAAQKIASGCLRHRVHPKPQMVSKNASLLTESRTHQGYAHQGRQGQNKGR